MSKVYCIVRTKDYVYVPIKAERSPYNGHPAYLRQLPNFFGGTVEKVWYINGQRRTKKRSKQAALCAEIFEESRHTINIEEESILRQMENGILLNTEVKQENYSFYLLSIPPEACSFPQDNVWNLREISAGQTRAEREMDYIIQVPITEITNRVSAVADAGTEAVAICHDPNPNPNVIDEFASKILSACSNIQYGHDNYFTGLLNGDPALKEDWNGSETKKAFAILAAVLFLHRPQQ